MLGFVRFRCNAPICTYPAHTSTYVNTRQQFDFASIAKQPGTFAKKGGPVTGFATPDAPPTNLQNPRRFPKVHQIRGLKGYRGLSNALTSLFLYPLINVVGLVGIVGIGDFMRFYSTDNGVLYCRCLSVIPTDACTTSGCCIPAVCRYILA
ncbi:hypothetical protein SDC9_129590 [bioreactor metagenome]|uniref:Uncharacterized protein n=1 Tax=bioreactor metagenome TaxID=1076179 RepID=A0A645D030_9ZZZZ